jgi:vancomycin resistance protein YoaR
MPVEEYHQQYGPIRRRQGNQPALPPDDLPPPNPPPTPRRVRRRRVQRRVSLAPFLVSLLLVLLLSPLALPYALPLVYGAGALPGVTVQGEPVAGRDQATLAADLAQRYAPFMHTPLTLEYGERTWSPTLAELGLQFDPAELAAQAVRVGQQGDPFTRLRDLYTLYRYGHDLTPRIAVDLPTLQNYLLSIAPTVEQPPEDAALSLAASRVIGTPSTPGVQLLVDATANDVLLAVRDLAPRTVPIRTRRLDPMVGDAALVAAQAQAVNLLQEPLELVRGEQRWIWEPERLAELLRVDAAAGRLQLSVDQAQLARAVEGLAQLTDSGTAEPRLRFVDGTVQIVEPGQPGWRLDQPATLDQLGSLLLRPDASRTLDLPGDVVLPQITADNVASLGIRELVGEGKSSFVGSAEYRITNIKAGAVRMDGVLIAPGEEFSFNRQLGEVNADNGFVEGYAIIGNRTQLEWGGGVCQDSTTVFRAAFWAGLPITERHAHTFYISWYDRFGLGPNGDGQGLDAAIYTGVNDLKFVNDTGYWLLMQTDVDEVSQTLTVRLYGTKPDREVRLAGPFITNEVRAPSQPVYVDDPTLPRGTVRQSDVARNGRDILIERIIIADGVERRESFFTRFRAWPNIYVRGTR